MPEDEENATVVSTDIAGNSSTHTEIDAIDTDAPSAITLDAPTT